MNYWKDLLIDRANGWDDDDEIVTGDLESMAALLGGEVDGKFIRCPSPRRPADDRSCYVLVNGPGKFFVYDCEGSQGAAYAYIRERLKLTPAAPSPDKSSFALRILDQTVPAQSTIVETYLRSRGLTLPTPPSLRFHPMLKHGPTGSFWPGMVATRTSVKGVVRAIHRTYLRRDGSGKAPIAPDKMDLGPREGGAIRLAPYAAELLTGEGIETTLAAMQLLNLPGWAAGSAPALRDLLLPPEVTSVVVTADNDGPGEAAARYAAQRWLREGRRVRIAWPPKAHNDFNDYLIAKVKAS